MLTPRPPKMRVRNPRAPSLGTHFSHLDTAPVRRHPLGRSAVALDLDLVLADPLAVGRVRAGHDDVVVAAELVDGVVDADAEFLLARRCVLRVRGGEGHGGDGR